MNRAKPADQPKFSQRQAESERNIDFATLMEPSNCREYVTMHRRLKVGPGDRLPDVACGAGLAVELARALGAECAGIDASRRLIAVAKDRSPDADLREGDMNALPWPDDSFDVVTSFRGIWGTTPAALDEVYRVLAPGGRLGFTSGFAERANLLRAAELPSYTIERVPRALTHVPPDGSTSGFVYPPPSADHRLVLALIDPGFGNEDSALIDMAVAFKFSPFEKNGGPDTGGPCG